MCTVILLIWEVVVSNPVSYNGPIKLTIYSVERDMPLSLVVFEFRNPRDPLIKQVFRSSGKANRIFCLYSSESFIPAYFYPYSGILDLLILPLHILQFLAGTPQQHNANYCGPNNRYLTNNDN